MKNFSLIPVVDIMNSIAVHAKKGERDQYKPLESVLSSSTDPINLVKAYISNLGLKKCYIADLDSILKQDPNIGVIEKILKIGGVKIWLDPGIRTENEIYYYKDYDNLSLVLGLESISNLNLLKHCLQIFEPKRLILSIDMYNSQLITGINNIKSYGVYKFVDLLNSLGYKNIILLDLYRIGQKVGKIPKNYLKILKIFHGNVYVGGGIKDITDVIEFRDRGFAGVLVGTSLNDGTITKSDLELNQFNQ